MTYKLSFTQANIQLNFKKWIYIAAFEINTVL